MNAKTTPRPVAALKLPKPVNDLINYARAIIAAMNANKSSFPAPSPSLLEIGGAVDDLEAAQKAVALHTRGAAGARNEKRVALAAKLDLLRGYVQSIADANHPDATGIIQSASMQIRKVAVRTRRAFSVKPGPVSGSVKVVTAPAGPRAAYDWAMSSDGGATWQPLPTTIQAHSGVTGLVVGTTYAFRVRAITKTGAGDWSEPVSIKVS
jgi:hypothetical protein